MKSGFCSNQAASAPVYLERPGVSNLFEITGRFILFASTALKLRGLSKLLAGYYCTPIDSGNNAAPDAIICLHLVDRPCDIAGTFDRFEISGGAVGYTDGRTCVFDFKNGRVIVYPGEPHLIDVMMRKKLDFQRFDDLQVLNYAISTALRRCDVYELHSGAVVEPQTKRGVLFVGASGSGKSTLTLQLVSNGWQFLTDDVLYLKNIRGVVNAYPWRRGFAVTRLTVDASGRRAREVFANADWSNGSKKAFMPHDLFPEGFSADCEPGSIFFPTITNEKQSAIRPLMRSETMIQLIKLCPWSCYDPVTSTRHLNVLTSLAKQCNGFKLLAGTDLLRDPARASELILEHGTV